MYVENSAKCFCTEWRMLCVCEKEEGEKCSDNQHTQYISKECYKKASFLIFNFGYTLFAAVARRFPYSIPRMYLSVYACVCVFYHMLEKYYIDEDSILYVVYIVTLFIVVVVDVAVVVVMHFFTATNQVVCIHYNIPNEHIIIFMFISNMLTFFPQSFSCSISIYIFVPSNFSIYRRRLPCYLFSQFASTYFFIFLSFNKKNIHFFSFWLILYRLHVHCYNNIHNRDHSLNRFEGKNKLVHSYTRCIHMHMQIYTFKTNIKN